MTQRNPKNLLNHVDTESFRYTMLQKWLPSNRVESMDVTYTLAKKNEILVNCNKQKMTCRQDLS